jgi:membrane associated rhomboid family serine protease
MLGRAMDESGERVALRVSRRRAQIDEWVLVLSAEGLRAAVRGGPDGFALEVDSEEAARADALLRAWQRENEAAPPPPPPAAAIDRRATRHALVVAGFLLALYAATGPAGTEDSAFGARGSAESARIRAGEAWRAVTALTLHADFGHVLGNAIAGALFLSAVFHLFGFGLGGALVLLAGVLGNLANAFVQAPAHATIGASTAVFGALGVLVGHALANRHTALERRPAWLPIGAALALLAMLGSEGARVDLWAHGFGLAAGVVAGASAAQLSARSLASPALQAIAGAGALAAIASAWWIALRS